ncbi:MAG: GGDEF domain-containing protein [Chromatiaceae bacterium]|nr:GGDEF domain-containing protein [Gammaproteobacteria bacterium]MCP5307128.1 GGDEF domain-containing protein [Chromatiaceae bacterium]MCP5312291.1 GGDEF domain-containing protein [Chromatiaceae bacterium]
METLGYINTGNLALVSPLQAHGTVLPTAPENLGPRVLELSSILQTTLDIQAQVLLFGKEIQRYLAIDGIVYTLPDSDETVVYGREGSHRATYDLKLEDKVLGSIRICREIPFAAKEIQSLENLLCALVYPLRNALSYKHAVELASRDPLTGVQNRMALSSALTREVDLAHRQELPLSLLVIDIDHFKRFNDEHGHTFGDDVLVAVSQTIANTIRRSDLLFRFGGEEFVVLASHTGEQGAMLLAERIRENIAALQTVRGRDVRITVSVGAARLQDADGPDQLFKRADKALYAAKDAGRNRSQLA